MLPKLEKYCRVELQAQKQNIKGKYQQLLKERDFWLYYHILTTIKKQEN